MTKKIWISIGILFLTAILVFLILRANSLNLALKSGGYSVSYTTFERGFNANDRAYTVIGTTKNEEIKLIYLEKNSLGFWKMWYDSPSIHSKFASTNWTNIAGFRKFDFQDNPQFTFEFHWLYYGINAVKRIELPLEKLPPGTAVNIQQSGDTYSIHLLSYEQPEKWKNIDIYQLLLESGSIEE
ncbi:hypothetical protein [Paenibacillus pinihumi]|uniref:hypothetical protein n=1 Tax=Paenibacillus pinihumi TaxID=669462 RepID=UPI000400DCA3|nr:hypothetical protein [Paenibacillus pinihumi]